jgi:nitrogen fixation protein FixH
MRIRFNWGTGIAMVYTAFAVATTGFVTFAMGRPVELVSADYYEQSLKQDGRIAAERNAAEIGTAISIDEPGVRVATIAFPPTQARDAQGTVTLYRPSDSRADRTLPLQLGIDGVQRVSLDRLASGRWVVQVRWSSAGRDYYVERGVYLR